MNHRVSILLSDGYLTSPEFYKKHKAESGEIVGVVVQTDYLGVIVAPELESLQFSDRDSLYGRKYNFGDGFQIQNGYQVTMDIWKAQKNVGIRTAISFCIGYQRGNMKWYLPTMLELETISAYWNEVMNCFKAAGITTIKKDSARDLFWSSCEYTDEYAMSVFLKTGSTEINYKTEFLTAMPVSSFNSLKANNV